MNRRPPKKTRAALRKEVNFGCPVDGCGSPYLSWHHFDPPWNIREHHDVPGMIALCPVHHAQANKGAFTVDQLRSMKKEPYLRTTRGLKGRFEWKREDMIMLAGGCWFVQPPFLIRTKEQNIIWMTKNSAGYEQLNITIQNGEGVEVFSMDRNDWIALRDLNDVECPPGGSDLTIDCKDERVFLRISFQNANRDVVMQMLLDQVEYDNRKRADSGEVTLDESTEETASRMLEAITRPFGMKDFAICKIEVKSDWSCPFTIDERRILIQGKKGYEAEFTLCWFIMKGLIIDEFGLDSISPDGRVHPCESQYEGLWKCKNCGATNTIGLLGPQGFLDPNRGLIQATCQQCSKRSTVYTRQVFYRKLDRT